MSKEELNGKGLPLENFKDDTNSKLAELNDHSTILMPGFDKSCTYVYDMKKIELF